MLRMAVCMGGDIFTIARYINDQLVADLPNGPFVTAWLAQLRSSDKSIVSFTAGQGPIIRYEAAEDCFHVSDAADAPPFGVLDNLEFPASSPLQLHAGDIVAVLSDGIFEAINDRKSQFGKARVLDILRARHDDSVGDILNALREAVATFSAGGPVTDDRTALIIKCVC